MYGKGRVLGLVKILCALGGDVYIASLCQQLVYQHHLPSPPHHHHYIFSHSSFLLLLKHKSTAPLLNLLLRLTCATFRTLTHTAGTGLHCIPPPKAPTPCMQDYHQSQTLSYVLKLCRFPRLTAVDQLQDCSKKFS